MQTKAQQYIQFNQDFNKLTLIKSDNNNKLQPTTMKGVCRLILQRRGDQIARRATSIVSYQPQSSFSSHTHSYGQQFYVLQGTFSDHTGDFSQGYYVRNPVKSSHAPFSKQGTRIFVKLAQMAIQQSQKLIIDTNKIQYHKLQSNKGVTIAELFKSQHSKQKVLLYKFSQSSQLQFNSQNDIIEILVIYGQIHILNETLPKQSWIRIPKQQTFIIKANKDSKIYMKKGKGIVRDKDFNQINQL